MTQTPEPLNAEPHNAGPFSAEQRKRIAQAVADAEAKTVAEIVPVVALRSGRYDRSEDIVGVWLAVIAAAVFWWCWPREAPAPGSWPAISPWVGVLLIVVAVVLAFIVGTVLASRFSGLCKLFTPQRQMQEEVAAKARQVFFDRRIHHTQSSCGLLVYVSLFERIAVVLADEKVMESLGQEAIDGLCKQLTNALHKGEVIDAMCAVIAAAGEQLAEPLPREDDDVNELDDALVVMD